MAQPVDKTIKWRDNAGKASELVVSRTVTVLPSPPPPPQPRLPDCDHNKVALTDLYSLQTQLMTLIPNITFLLTTHQTQVKLSGGPNTLHGKPSSSFSQTLHNC